MVCSECHMAVRHPFKATLATGRCFRCRYVLPPAAVGEMNERLNDRHYEFTGEAPPAAQPAGHPAFHAILAEMAALHDKKAADYGGNDDPLRNLRRGGAAINVEAWKAAFSRMGDKFGRIEQFIKKGKLENEGVEDSFKDIAVYAILSLILFREESK